MRKKYVLVRINSETNLHFILAFSDSFKDLCDIMRSHARYNSNRYFFFVCSNDNDKFLFSKSIESIKDECLINICKIVAEYLSIAEFAMLERSFFKSASWYDKAKNSCSLGSDIIDNY